MTGPSPQPAYEAPQTQFGSRSASCTRPAPPGGPPFQSELESQWARTATAEGPPQNSPSRPREVERTRPGHSGQVNEGRASSDGTRPCPPAELAGQPGAHVPVAPNPEGSAAQVAPAGTPGVAARSTATLASTIPGGARAAQAPSGSSAAGAAPTQDAALAAGSTPGANPPGVQALGSQSAGTQAAGGPPTGPLAATGPDPAQAATLGGGTQATAGETLAAGNSVSTPGATASTSGATAASPSAPAAQPTTPSRGSSSTRARDASLTVSPPSSAAQIETSGAPATPASTARTDIHHGAGEANRLRVPDAAGPIATSGPSAGGGSAGAGSSIPGFAEATPSGLASTTLAGAGQAPLVNYGVGLQQAIETAHAAIQFAAREGLSQARIALQPQELGEIRIYLSQNAAGLVARLTAQTPAAAQALAAGHAELRQSLNSIGISLAHLDIGHLDQSGAQGGANHQRPGGQAPLDARPTSAATVEGHDDLDDGPTAEELAPRAPAPSGGALVDVLA
jgi:flagellar hook-length control protein FliK